MEERILGVRTATSNRMGTRMRIFNNELEYNSFYFRVGQHFRSRTPCVSGELVDADFPIVFEEWQLKVT